ncbi:hypothetical protein [Arthrobacter sp. NPDC056493]|uniref:hypothetical protein n=1 Tax=Arthrobacter sp. NPDC056493 TaxID=3345839 RepID=UPI003671DB58
MQRPSEESKGATLRFVAFLVVSLFVILLVWGHTGIELLVFLGLVLALTGIQYLIDKFLLDNYRQ